MWAFDLLFLDGADLRNQPLIERKALLERLLHKANDDWLRLSETFKDGVKLFAACERMGLEGIVSKKRDAPYRSGKGDWIKVKCPNWRCQQGSRRPLQESQAQMTEPRTDADLFDVLSAVTITGPDAQDTSANPAGRSTRAWIMGDCAGLKAPGRSPR